MSRPKGFTLTEEHKRKISLAHIGIQPSQESIEKNRLIHLGKHYSPSTELKKGNIPWNKGIKMTKEQKNKLNPTGLILGQKLTGNYQPKGSSNKCWKGDRIGYEALHKWLKTELGKPTFCALNRKHITKRFVWANISGEYKRDLSDYHSLCIRCNYFDGIKKHERFKVEYE